MVTTLAARLVLAALPIVFMILLIPFVRSDAALAGIYLAIIAISALRYQKKDFLFLAFGFVALLLSELLFVSTGVERFERTSLLGIMPLWLPLLWAYVFVVIRRAAGFFEKYL